MVRKLIGAGGWNKHTSQAGTLLRREQAQTAELTAIVQHRIASAPWARPAWQEQLAYRLAQKATTGRKLTPAIIEAIHTTARALIALEVTALSVPSEHPASLLEGLQLKARLRALADFIPHAEPPMRAWIKSLEQVLASIAAAVPNLPAPEPATITLSLPLIDLIANPRPLVSSITTTLLRLATDDALALRPGATAASQVKHALLNASRINEDAARKNPHRLITPDRSTLSGAELVAAYLPAPLVACLTTPIPLPVHDRIRVEHQHLIAGTGTGKTQTIQHFIIADLKRPTHDVPSLVIIDSKGPMLQKIAHLQRFDPDRGELAGRLLIVDPTDIDHPPGLNLFDLNTARIAAYGKAAQEQLLSGIIELYDYIFGALLDAELTQ